MRPDTSIHFLTCLYDCPHDAPRAHQKIRNKLVTEIESGSLSSGDRLPGETQLASRFGVTRMTLRQALAAMVNDGLLVRRQDADTFVAENAARRRNMSRLTGFSEDMAH
jgi:GntR family transcriptional regulator